MDRETKKYVTRVKNKTGISSDGVPNRKGGSWPNHPSMRYELPLPFSPGADQVSDVYREKYVDTFGPQADIAARFCPKCDKTWSWCECKEAPCSESPAP